MCHCQERDRESVGVRRDGSETDARHEDCAFIKSGALATATIESVSQAALRNRAARLYHRAPVATRTESAYCRLSVLFRHARSSCFTISRPISQYLLINLLQALFAATRELQKQISEIEIFTVDYFRVCARCSQTVEPQKTSRVIDSLTCRGRCLQVSRFVTHLVRCVCMCCISIVHLADQLLLFCCISHTHIPHLATFPGR